jgi:hypothetical protein
MRYRKKHNMTPSNLPSSARKKQKLTQHQIPQGQSLPTRGKAHHCGIFPGSI